MIQPLANRVLIKPKKNNNIRESGIVLHTKYGGTEIKIDNETFLIKNASPKWLGWMIK